MNRLIIICGTYGPWKSQLLYDLTKLSSNFVFVEKNSTFKKPQNENYAKTLNLKFDCDPEHIRKCDYTYQYFGSWYGIFKKDITDVLKSNKTPLLMVSDSSVIKDLKKDFKYTMMLYIHCFSDEEYVKNLKKYGDEMSSEKMKKREKYNLSIFNECFSYKLVDRFEMYSFEDENFISQLTQTIYNGKAEKQEIISNIVSIIMSSIIKLYRGKK